MRHEFKEIITNLMYIDDFFEEKGKREIFNIEMFSQVWPNTCLGFGGFGGDAITSAMTYVIYSTEKNELGEEITAYHIFFGGRYAYSVTDPTKKFFEDLKNKHMASCMEAHSIY